MRSKQLPTVCLLTVVVFFVTTYRVWMTKPAEKNVGQPTRIGILIPSCTRNIRHPSLHNLSLTNICLPSIYRTMEREFEYFIYIGINRDDYLETVSQVLEETFRQVKVVVSAVKTFTATVNNIAREAYRDEMDYLVRINDDTSFQTKNWTSAGIHILRNSQPQNVGVVGPVCFEGNTKILTHDMLHRTHLDIFDYYYPPHFDNWWSDDWITAVYQPDRSKKLKNWVVKHHVDAHGTRYSVNVKKKEHLELLLTFDRKRLDEFCRNTQNSSP